MIKKILLLVFVSLSSFNFFAQPGGEAALIPYLKEISNAVRTGNAKELTELGKTGAFLAEVVEQGKKIQAIYDLVDLQSIKQLYDLYNKYICIATDFEILLAMNGNINDCVLDFQIDKALFKFTVSKEIMTGLGLLNAAAKFKSSQSDQLKLLENCVKLLEESFMEINQINGILRKQLRWNVEKQYGLDKYGESGLAIDKTSLDTNFKFKKSPQVSLIAVDEFEGVNFEQQISKLVNEQMVTDNEIDEQLEKVKDSAEMNPDSKNDLRYNILDWIVYFVSAVGGLYVMSGFLYDAHNKTTRLIGFSVGLILAMIYFMFRNL